MASKDTTSSRKEVDAEVDPLACGSFGDFFISRDYETKSYSWKVKRKGGEDPRFPAPNDCGDKEHTVEVTQNIEALAAAATDFDLTGQIVWLISVVTAHYIAAEGWRDVAGRPCIELGAGCGLTGLAAAQWASSVALTDFEDEVLSLLKLNLVHVPSTCAATVNCLSWGDEGDHAHLAAETGHGTYPVIVGADIVYWSNSIKPLFQSVARLLQRPGDSDSSENGFEPVFILGYRNRVDSMRRALLEEAAAAGLTWTEVGWDWLGPTPPPEYVDNLPHMTIFRFTWKK